jgi:hypothetical protein
MRRKPPLVNKQLLKKVMGKCRMCPEQAYHRLDVHRRTPGAVGGRYTYSQNGEKNAIVLCSTCHRDAEKGLFTIDRFYLCTDGSYKLRVIYPDGSEKFF